MAAKKPRNMYFWIGLTLYALSFFLFAVDESGFLAGSPVRGYFCAELAFHSWVDFRAMAPGGEFADNRFAFVCLLITAWINPIFLFYCIRPIRILRRALLPMIPCCWIFFYYEGLIPREGHVLWVLGMLLVLFSDRLNPKPLAAGVVRPRLRLSLPRSQRRETYPTPKPAVEFVAAHFSAPSLLRQRLPTAARLFPTTLISSPFVPAAREAVYRQNRRAIRQSQFHAPATHH
ncbi:MAG: hypothetical protein WCA00_15870 [Candidatus Acidiferrales bacterium]